MERLRTELSSSLSLLASSKRQLVEHEQLISKLQQELSQANASHVELSAAKASISKLERDLQHKSLRLEVAEGATEKLQQDLVSRDRLLALAQSQAASALDTVSACQSATDSGQSPQVADLLSGLNQQNAFLRSRVSELENDLLQQCEDSKVRFHDAALLASSERESLLLQIASLETQLAGQSQEIRQLNEARAADLCDHKEQMKRVSAEALAAAELDILLTAEKSSFDARIQELTQSSESELLDLRSKLHAAECVVKDASERDISNRLQIAQLEAEVLTLRSQITDSNSASTHAPQSQWSDYVEKSPLESALDEECKALRLQLESQLEDFQGIMHAKDHIIEQLTDQVRKLQKQVEDAQAVNQVNSNTIVSQSSIIGKLQSEIDQFSVQQSTAPAAVRQALSSSLLPLPLVRRRAFYSFTPGSAECQF
jgi:hypothetical protein